jgi:hypothetical protein
MLYAGNPVEERNNVAGVYVRAIQDPGPGCQGGLVVQVVADPSLETGLQHQQAVVKRFGRDEPI